MRRLALALAFALWSSTALAASCFWVGGTGTTSDATKWSSSSGGAGSTCAGPGGIPDSGDTATWDGSSGGGTVTVAAGGTWTLQSVTMGAFTGTWTNATNNRNITVTNSGNAFNISGSGTRTINLGSATYTLSNNTAPSFTATTTTNLTFSAGTSNIVFSGTGSGTLTTGNLTYATVTFGSITTGSRSITSGSGCTITTLTIQAPNYVRFTAGQTVTLPSGISVVGSAAGQIGFISDTLGTAATLALGSAGTASYVAFRDITATTSVFTASNSFNLGNNTGITITAPTGGGGGGIIGG